MSQGHRRKHDWRPAVVDALDVVDLKQAFSVSPEWNETAWGL